MLALDEMLDEAIFSNLMTFGHLMDLVKKARKHTFVANDPINIR